MNIVITYKGDRVYPVTFFILFLCGIHFLKQFTQKFTFLLSLHSFVNIMVLLRLKYRLKIILKAYIFEKKIVCYILCLTNISQKYFIQ